MATLDLEKLARALPGEILIIIGLAQSYVSAGTIDLQTLAFIGWVTLLTVALATVFVKILLTGVPKMTTWKGSDALPVIGITAVSVVQALCYTLAVFCAPLVVPNAPSPILGINLLQAVEFCSVIFGTTLAGLAGLKIN